MSINLFKHNLDAYNAVVSMLSETGKGVQKLLNMYEGVPILGLFATKIRYLDNQGERCPLGKIKTRSYWMS